MYSVFTALAKCNCIPILIQIVIYSGFPPFPIPSSLGQQFGRGDVANEVDGVNEVDLLPEERVSIAVYQKCNRSVVNIRTEVLRESFLGEPLQLREATGSGSVIDKQGHILTCQHVIAGASRIVVSLHNGNSYPAAVVGEDALTDVAILRISPLDDELFPIQFSVDPRLQEGQRIYAIGNPFGLERSMSSGMISSLNRQIHSKDGNELHSLIQIDASINQGDSGGPLLNTSSKMIGMNTAIMCNGVDSAGIGLAIPVSTLVRVVPRLLQGGRVVRPSIGIERVYESSRGVLVVSVAEGGPAANAGLRGFSLVRNRDYNIVDTSVADCIVEFDSQHISSASDLLAAIDKHRPGDLVTLLVERQGTHQNIRLRLATDE